MRFRRHAQHTTHRRSSFLRFPSSRATRARRLDQMLVISTRREYRLARCRQRKLTGTPLHAQPGAVTGLPHDHLQCHRDVIDARFDMLASREDDYADKLMARRYFSMIDGHDAFDDRLLPADMPDIHDNTCRAEGAIIEARWPLGLSDALYAP